MLHPQKKRVWMLGGVLIAAVLGLFVALDTTQAQEELVVGTYDIQQVAAQAGIQQTMQQEMAGLQGRMQEAQTSGDQQAMQQIQQEAQQIQQKVVGDFEASIDESLPGIAEDAGVKIIAQAIDYTAPGIETKDLTEAIIEEVGGAAPANPPITIQPTPQAQ